jgi:hypothetical protein
MRTVPLTAPAGIDGEYGPVGPAYNPYFQFVFLVGTIFFSHNKSANSVF